MASGFFLGGLAQGFQDQSRITAAQNYQSGLLKLEQQRLQQQANREIQAEIDKHQESLFQHIDDVKVANNGPHDPKALYQANAANIEGIAALIKQTKGPEAEALFRAQVAAQVAAPPSTQIMAAQARAKEGPQHQALVQSEIEKNRAVAGTDNNFNSRFTGANPDVPGPGSPEGAGLGGPQRPPGISPTAWAISQYKAPPPSAYAMRSAAGKKLMDEIFTANPNYDAKQYKPMSQAAGADVRADSNALNELVKNRAAVKTFEDTALKSGEYLTKLAQKVDKTGIPLIERLRRPGAALLGDPDVTDFNTQLQIFKADVARIATQPRLVGQLTDSARQELAQAQQPSATAEQILHFYNLAKRDFGFRRDSLDTEISSLRKRLKGEAGGDQSGDKDSDAGWEEVPGMPGVKMRRVSP